MNVVHSRKIPMWQHQADVALAHRTELITLAFHDGLPKMYRLSGLWYDLDVSVVVLTMVTVPYLVARNAAYDVVKSPGRIPKRRVGSIIRPRQQQYDGEIHCGKWLQWSCTVEKQHRTP